MWHPQKKSTKIVQLREFLGIPSPTAPLFFLQSPNPRKGRGSRGKRVARFFLPSHKATRKGVALWWKKSEALEEEEWGSIGRKGGL